MASRSPRRKTSVCELGRDVSRMLSKVRQAQVCSKVRQESPPAAGRSKTVSAVVKQIARALGKYQIEKIEFFVR